MKDKFIHITALLALILLVLSFSSSAMATYEYQQANESNNGYVTGTSEVGYSIDIYLHRDTEAIIKYEKLNKTKYPPSPLLIIDGHNERVQGPELERGETWSTTLNLDTRFDVTNSSHNVGIYTPGPQLETTVHKEYDLEDPKIPATRIRDVEVVETTYNGEPTAAVDVVLENPSPRSYSARIYAHTLQTNSKKGIATVPVDNTTKVERIILREDPDDEVEGELRMTTARLDEDRGLRDQVWFRGTADGDTEWQREPYEPVGYQNGDDPYRYSRNEGTLESLGLSLAHVVAGGAFVIGCSVVVFRRRTRW